MSKPLSIRFDSASLMSRADMVKKLNVLKCVKDGQVLLPGLAAFLMERVERYDKWAKQNTLAYPIQCQFKFQAAQETGLALGIDIAVCIEHG